MTGPQRGFTLLELLVALAIFAVVASLAWGGLDLLARSRRVLDNESQRLAELQRGLGRFERDVRQALPRAIRNATGASGQALVGDALGLEWSVAQPAGGWLLPGPELRRVAWRCAEQGLMQRRWSALDRTASTPVVEQLLIPGASDCRIRYYPSRGLPVDRWPPRDGQEVFPRAIELTFVRLGQAGVRESFRRLVELPQNPELSP